MKYKAVLPVAGLLAGVSVQGALLVDDFNSPPLGQEISTPVIAGVFPFSWTGDAFVGAGTIGGWRDVGVGGLTAQGVVSTASVNLNFDGTASLVNNVGSMAFGGWEYDANNAGLDLSAGPGEVVTFQYGIDHPTVFRVTLSSGLVLGVPTGTATWAVAHLAGGGVAVSPNLGSWAVLGAFNLADVDVIRLEALPLAAGGDVEIDNLYIVPEPSTYAGMFALGLAGFAAFRRVRG